MSQKHFGKDRKDLPKRFHAVAIAMPEPTGIHETHGIAYRTPADEMKKILEEHSKCEVLNESPEIAPQNEVIKIEEIEL